jgi:hypothetical protein
MESDDNDEQVIVDQSGGNGDLEAPRKLKPWKQVSKESKSQGLDEDGAPEERMMNAKKVEADMREAGLTLVTSRGETALWLGLEDETQAAADAYIAKQWRLNRREEWQQMDTEMVSTAFSERSMYQVIDQSFLSNSGGQPMALTRIDLSDAREGAENADAFGFVQFARETRLMQNLHGEHHNLLPYDWATVGRWGYLLTSLPEHPNLATYLTAALYLGWDETSVWELIGRKAAREISDAILYLYRTGMGHGDLRLDHILVEDVSEVSYVPSREKRHLTPLPRWLQEEVNKNKGLSVAIDDLSHGLVPEHFILSDFRLAGPQGERKETGNNLPLVSIDEHMWRESLNQLVHLSDDFHDQMVDQNKVYIVEKRQWRGLSEQVRHFRQLLTAAKGGSVDKTKTYLENPTTVSVPYPVPSNTRLVTLTAE